jgi:ABC-type Fe3+ transport system substrate-binding protein
MLTNGEPQGLAKAFIDFVLSADGQAIVAEEYIAVTD